MLIKALNELNENIFSLIKHIYELVNLFWWLTSKHAWFIISMPAAMLMLGSVETQHQTQCAEACLFVFYTSAVFVSDVLSKYLQDITCCSMFSNHRQLFVYKNLFCCCCVLP